MCCLFSPHCNRWAVTAGKHTHIQSALPYPSCDYASTEQVLLRTPLVFKRTPKYKSTYMVFGLLTRLGLQLFSWYWNGYNFTTECNWPHIYFLYHIDEWWRDTWPNPSVHLCRPERVGCHQPCWLALWNDYINNITCTDKHLLFGSTRLLMRALTISRSPREHSRERGVSPASFTATVTWIQANCGHYTKITVHSTHTCCQIFHGLLDRVVEK